MPYLQAAPETPTVSLSPDAEIPVLQNREPAVPDYSDRDYTFCQQPGKQTAPYVESTCEQPVYKLAELLCLPVNSIRPVWNTGF